MLICPVIKCWKILLTSQPKSSHCFFSLTQDSIKLCNLYPTSETKGFIRPALSREANGYTSSYNHGSQKWVPPVEPLPFKQISPFYTEPWSYGRKSNKPLITGWCFQIFFIFTPKIGEGYPVDYIIFFSLGGSTTN